MSLSADELTVLLATAPSDPEERKLWKIRNFIALYSSPIADVMAALNSELAPDTRPVEERANFAMEALFVEGLMADPDNTFSDEERLEVARESIALGFPTLIEEIKQLRIDAERWRALLNCDRIRTMGYSKRSTDHMHMGLEFWVRHPPLLPSNEEANKQLLIDFADAAAAYQNAK